MQKATQSIAHLHSCPDLSILLLLVPSLTPLHFDLWAVWYLVTHHMGACHYQQEHTS